MSCVVWSQGVEIDRDLTLLQTGGREPLISFDMTLDALNQDLPPVLQFDFGFATDEVGAPGEFADSFSVTLQGSDPAQSVLLLTADVNGVAWAPENPGGVPISADEVKHTEQPFAKVDSTLAAKVAYSVTFAIPRAFLGNPVKVFFDLFDNLNSAASLAYVRQAGVQSARLESAEEAGGPYEGEVSALLDEAIHTFTLKRSAASARFFRVLGPHSSRIVSLTAAGETIQVRYAPVPIKLQSAAAVDGAYSEESSAIIDELQRTIRVAKPGATRFYRVASDVPWQLLKSSVSAGQLVFQYEISSK
jgi:hypothetical protein